MQARDGEGLRRLLGDHGGRIRWWLRREFAALNDHDLDEVMSIAALRAWRAADRFDEARGALRAWFYVIVRRCALTVLRREQRVRTFTLLDPDQGARWPDNGAPAESESESEPEPAKFVLDLRDCIERLPSLQRAIIEADLRSGEIADAEGLAKEHGSSRNSIYASRSYARRALRRCMAAKGHHVEAPPAPRETHK